jgi:hypothetical protein
MPERVPPPEPMPPEEWPTRIPTEAEDGPRHEFPARPEVVQVTESDLGERAQGPAEHEGHAPRDVPRHSTPTLLRPEQSRPGLWRRPPGQKDDLGEPT